MSSGPDLDGFEEVIERLSAEKEDVATRRTGACAGVVDVEPVIPWEENVACSHEQDLLAVAAFGEIETASTLGMRSGLGSDGEPEHRSKRTANIDSWVQVGNGFEEGWTGRLGVDGLPILNLDVSDTKLLEEV